METNEKTLSQTIEKATDLLVKFVVPLYEDDHRGRPSLHGSGFFVKANEHYFLVSAAHVLETLKKKSLYYYITNATTRKLSGKLLLNSWHGDRVRDPIDVGVLKLSSEGLPPYPKVDKFAMDISCLRPGFLPRSGKNYMIVGFPASQSKVIRMTRTIAVTPYGYFNYSVEDSEYSKHGLAPERHLALSLDLEVGFDSNGKHRNFPRPQGMSGSPIWVLYDDNGRNTDRVFPVVALGTKYRKNRRIIVGTDIAVAVDMIKKLANNVA